MTGHISWSVQVFGVWSPRQCDRCPLANHPDSQLSSRMEFSLDWILIRYAHRSRSRGWRTIAQVNYNSSLMAFQNNRPDKFRNLFLSCFSKFSSRTSAKLILSKFISALLAHAWKISVPHLSSSVMELVELATTSPTSSPSGSPRLRMIKSSRQVWKLLFDDSFLIRKVTILNNYSFSKV